MNTPSDSERLQNALANLATVMVKIITTRVDQTLAEVLPVKLPAHPEDKTGADRVLTQKQVAELLQISRRTLFAWMKTGRLPYVKIGRCVRFLQGDVLRHLDRIKIGGHA